jgi:phthalate 4,5-cis-dihydrodiol dehydrogenase
VKTIRIGVAGLGRAFSLTAPAFGDPRVRLVAAADPRPEARLRFERDYGARAYPSVAELCSDAAVDVVYVATPHEFHAEHAILAAARGKHVLVEKPMALTLPDCHAMIEAAHRAGVQLVVGHSHSYDAPIRKTAELIGTGRYGGVRMVTTLDYTDWVYRPRRPEELDTAVHNQASHQVSIVRRLAGSRVRSVRAYAGSFDAARPAQGAWSCQLGFEDGVFATLVYSGYAHFDSDEFMGWIGEAGQQKDPRSYWPARSAPPDDELALKNARNYGGDKFSLVQPVAHQHFGLVIVSCERADLRPLPHGVMIHGDVEWKMEPLPPPVLPRVEVIDELYGAVVEGRPPLHGGAWAMATLAVCEAIVRSAREGREVLL